MPTSLDTTACEQEPIRFPGAVQPHGALLVLDPESGLIEAASESCLALLGAPAGSLIGRSLAQIFGTAADQGLTVASCDGLEAVVPLAHGGRALSARCCRNAAGQVLIDIEPAADDAALRSLTAAFRRELPRLRAMTQVTQIAQHAADLVRTLTGFDRVMVYRFDAACNGEVIAEARDAAIESYLGLNFPASDIPAQARVLFLQNRVRMIGDVRYTPAALVARGDPRAIDLGSSGLRSVSPLHLEYLANMQVRATLVGSLQIDGKLWGLVSCQQKAEPRYFAPEQRDAVGWFCEDLAALIKSTLNHRRREREVDLGQRRRRLVEEIRSVHIKALIQKGSVADLLGAVSADGFALLADRSIHTAGVTPDRGRIRAMQRQRRARETDPTLFVTNALTVDLGLEETDDGVAGAIFVSLRDRPNFTLIWFRNERRQSVRWGGDPSRAHVADDTGRLSPRNSFQQFLQTVRGQCLHWTDEELDSARELAALIEIEALRDGGAFSESILDSIPANIVVLDDQGVIVAANDSWKRFADQNGAPGLATTSVGLSYRDICTAAVDQPEAGEAAAAWAGIEAVQNRSLDHYTLDYVCDAPTEKRWYRMSVYPMREPAAGTVVMHDNITRSKQTEMRLDDERTLLGTLLATIPDLVWLKDPNGVYLTCNAQFEALFGAPQADIVGRTDHDFVPAAQAEEYLRGDRHAMQAARPCLFEEWITYAKDGRRALVETTRTPMLDGRGALVGVLGVARDITERHIMQQQVQQLALFDPLTHLANRRLLGDRLGQAIATCNRAGGGLAVMFIDLDNFKPINDTHGHKAGDLLLLEVARRLKASVRETDTVARFGGDEFVVLVGQLDVDERGARGQAGKIAEKLRAALAVPFELDVGAADQASTLVHHRCTASFGVAMVTDLKSRAEDLLRWADMAMYQAKSAGRNRVHFFEQPTGAAR